MLKRVKNFHFAVKDTGKEVYSCENLSRVRQTGVTVSMWHSLAGIPGR